MEFWSIIEYDSDIHNAVVEASTTALWISDINSDKDTSTDSTLKKKGYHGDITNRNNHPLQFRVYFIHLITWLVCVFSSTRPFKGKLFLSLLVNTLKLM